MRVYRGDLVDVQRSDGTVGQGMKLPAHRHAAPSAARQTHKGLAVKKGGSVGLAQQAAVGCQRRFEPEHRIQATTQVLTSTKPEIRHVQRVGADLIQASVGGALVGFGGDARTDQPVNLNPHLLLCGCAGGCAERNGGERQVQGFELHRASLQLLLVKGTGTGTGK